LADYLEISGWKKWALMAACAVGGSVLGAFLGPYIAKLGTEVATYLGIQAAKAIPLIGTQIGKLGKLVDSLKPIIQGVTQHGQERMIERGISRALAQDIVSSGYAIEQSGGKVLYFTQEGVVVLNNLMEIVTAYLAAEFDAAMQEIIQQFYGGLS
jgi:hypothetical protein